MIAQYVSGAGISATSGTGGYFVGGSNGVGVIAKHGSGGRVGLRVEGDLEVTGDMPKVHHVCKCEVAPVVTRCEVYQQEPAPTPHAHVWESPLFGGCVAVAFLLGIATRRLFHG